MKCLRPFRERGEKKSSFFNFEIFRFVRHDRVSLTFYYIKKALAENALQLVKYSIAEQPASKLTLLLEKLALY